MPDIRQLRRFVAVAAEKNFRRAAAQLHISQPPLSDSIRQLEETVGVPLLLRDRRRVELTRAGEVFLERAQLILAQVDDAVDRARSVGEGLSGHLAVGFFPTATYHLLPEILRRFRERNAGVRIRFVELTTPEQPAALEQKRIDVALFLAPTVDRPGIARETILCESLFVALPAGHSLAKLETIALEQLHAEPFISIPPRWGTGYHARISYACQEAGFTPNVIEEVEHLHTMVSLVAAGMGVALVASSICRFQPDGVVYRRLVDPSELLQVEYGMAWRTGDGSPLVAAIRAAATLPFDAVED